MPNPPTLDDLDALEAVLAKMTPGKFIPSGSDTPPAPRNIAHFPWINTLEYSAATELSEADARGLCALRNAAPSLITELRRLREVKKVYETARTNEAEARAFATEREADADRWATELNTTYVERDAARAQVASLLEENARLAGEVAASRAIVAAAYSDAALVLGEDKQDEWPASAILDKMPMDARQALDAMLREARNRGQDDCANVGGIREAAYAEERAACVRECAIVFREVLNDEENHGIKWTRLEVWKAIMKRIEERGINTRQTEEPYR